jgi:hypothetical protein
MTSTNFKILVSTSTGSPSISMMVALCPGNEYRDPHAGSGLISVGQLPWWRPTFSSVSSRYCSLSGRLLLGGSTISSESG